MEIEFSSTDVRHFRYILFMIDSKIKQHDGKIFSSLKDARQYVAECMDQSYCDKAVIGCFMNDPNAKEMFISQIETIGFKGDKKQTEQLDLFSGLTLNTKP